MNTITHDNIFLCLTEIENPDASIPPAKGTPVRKLQGTGIFWNSGIAYLGLEN